MKDFDSFKQTCIDILAQSDNCVESQQLFHAAQNMTDMVLAWQKFWAGVLREVPEQVMKAFEELYAEYGPDINRAGMYYNEKPPVSNGATVLVGNHEGPLEINGRARVYVIGKAQVFAFDNVSVQCENEDAIIDLYDNSRAIMNGGTCVAHENGTLINGKGKFVSYAGTIYIAGGTLEDHGHNQIVAFNDAVINSFTHKNITLNDNAKLVIR